MTGAQSAAQERAYDFVRVGEEGRRVYARGEPRGDPEPRPRPPVANGGVRSLRRRGPQADEVEDIPRAGERERGVVDDHEFPREFGAEI